MTNKDKCRLIGYSVEGIITAMAVAFIFLIAVGPKSFGDSAILILIMSFGAAGVAMGCTHIIFEELIKIYESSCEENANEGHVSR